MSVPYRIIVFKICLCLAALTGVAHAQNSGGATETETTAETVDLLSKKAASFRKVIAALEADVKAAEERAAEALGQLQDLQNERDALRAELNDLRQQESDAINRTEEAKAELERLLAEKSEVEVARQAAERSAREAATERDNAAQENEALKAETRAALTKRDAVISSTETLSAILGALREEQAQAQAVLDELKTELEKIANDRDAAASEYKALTTQTQAALVERDDVIASTETLSAMLGALREEQTQAQAELDSLTKALQDAAEPPAGKPSIDQMNDAAKQRENMLQPAQVAQALAIAPGLETASAEQRARLQQLLIDGACTYDALDAVFPSINRQTLASLIRDLGRC